MPPVAPKVVPDRIPGGRAKGRRASEFDPIQLLVGMGVELEHTPDIFKALEIAMDHLSEFPDYYTHLIDMEKSLEAQKTESLVAVRRYLEAC